MTLKLYKKGIGFDIVVMAITRVITMIFGIVVTRLLSTKLSLNDYGTYSEALTLISVITSITIFGLVDAEVFFFNREANKEKREKSVNTIFMIEIVISLIAAGLVLAFSSLIVNYYSNPKLMTLIFIIALQPIVDNLFNLVSTLFIAEGRSIALAIRNAITATIKLGIVCLGIFIFKGIFWVMLLTIICNVVELLLFVIIYKKSSFLINPFKCDVKQIKTIVSFSFSVFLAVIINILLKQCDKLVLGGLASTETIAIYENASKQLPFDIIVSAAVTVSTPAISYYLVNNKDKELGLFLNNYISLCLMSLLIFAFPALLSSKEIITILYGERFLEGNSVFIIYTIAEIVKFANLSIVLISKNRRTELVIFLLFSLVANIGLDRLLFMEFGPVGCAIATLAITLSMQVYLLIRTHGLTSIPFLKMIKWKQLFFILGECLIMAVVIIIAKPYINAIVTNVFIRFLLYYMIPFAILLLANIKTLINIYRQMNKVSKELKNEYGDSATTN